MYLPCEGNEHWCRWPNDIWQKNDSVWGLIMSSFVLIPRSCEWSQKCTSLHLSFSDNKQVTSHVFISVIPRSPLNISDLQRNIPAAPSWPLWLVLLRAAQTNSLTAQARSAWLRSGGGNDRFLQSCCTVWCRVKFLALIGDRGGSENLTYAPYAIV